MYYISFLKETWGKSNLILANKISFTRASHGPRVSQVNQYSMQQQPEQVPVNVKLSIKLTLNIAITVPSNITAALPTSETFMSIKPLTNWQGYRCGAKRQLNMDRGHGPILHVSFFMKDYYCIGRWIKRRDKIDSLFAIEHIKGKCWS